MSGFSTITAAHEETIGAPALPWMKNLVEKKAGESSQILLVAGCSPELFSAKIYPFERHKSEWSLIYKPIDSTIGENGFALPGKKREGDGKTPSGVYPLEFAFGYYPEIHTKMNYFQATEDDVWVDDVDSSDYNQLVKRGRTNANSFEDMRRNDNLYKYGIVIGYNKDPVVKGYGSAIFFHVWRGEGKPTAGCVAMPEEDITTILGWLDPSKKPLVIMGTVKMLKDMAKEQE
jgi:L,D-peptidoglycan transpeptidase YkuD (ErfK/YbiS/YcfS/YnhG family)